MNFRFFPTIIILLISINLSGQKKLSGTIYDADTKQPIEYASVFINGTTWGTITDSSGYFYFEKMIIPSLLVVSHIGYETGTLNLVSDQQSKIKINLKPKKIIVDEVSVVNKNNREKNLALFKKLFLGTDIWGKYASIENEDALTFCYDYNTMEMDVENKNSFLLPFNAIEPVWNVDSTKLYYKIPTNFNVYANAPLIIDLPLLGYKLYYNLIHFIWGGDLAIHSDHCSILGYYYFQSLTYESKRDSLRIIRNRQRAYYNSQMHFCRSLYQKRLLENGYLVGEYTIGITNGKLYLREIQLDKFLSFKNDYAEVIGPKYKEFYILYYDQLNGKPINLTVKEGYKPYKTRFQFLKDTCIIRNDGTVPNNSIGFRSVIGDKRLGAYLPNDYDPSDK